MVALQICEPRQDRLQPPLQIYEAVIITSFVRKIQGEMSHCVIYVKYVHE